MQRLAGKVALVTGAARGQGRAHALRLAGEGADILAFDACTTFEGVEYDPSTVEDLEETGRLVEAEDRRAVVRQLDARDLAAVEAFVKDGVAELGGLDVVVVNHGICNYGFTWELGEAQWEEMISVCLTGVWKVLRATVPYLIEQGRGGSIVITSSVAGLRGLPFLSHYSAAKHGVVGLAKSLANELGRYDIRVNTVHPGGVRTVMGGADFNGERGQPEVFGGALNDPELASTLGPIFMNALPYRHMEPEDISNAVAFLASDEARYVTGVQMPVDFGTLIR
jgi:SDR family mycofactocin-dependent oxidoreductase